MNRTAIDWAGWSWNPVTGCYGPGGKGPCGYCYARRIAERFGGDYSQSELDPRGAVAGGDFVAGPGQVFPVGFLPTFYPHRLAEPAKVRKPARIFVSSMGDLFGEWVPTDWIARVLQVIRACPQHSFLLLTKNPRRYGEFEFPGNAWLGTTVTGGEPEDERLCVLSGAPSPNLWVSHEPILGPYPELWVGGYVRWLILGSQTGPGAKSPEEAWVRRVAEFNRSLPPGDASALFIKSNLAPYCRDWGIPVTQEYPEGMVGRQRSSPNGDGLRLREEKPHAPR